MKSPPEYWHQLVARDRGDSLTISFRRYAPQTALDRIGAWAILLGWLATSGMAFAYWFFIPVPSSAILAFWTVFVLSTGLLIWLRFSVTTLTVTNESIEVRLGVIVRYRTARFDSRDIECIEQEHEGDEVDDDSSCLVIRHSGRFPERFLHYCP